MTTLKERRAVKRRVRLFEAEDIYVIPVSGGKDSQLVAEEAVARYGPGRCRLVHHFTGIDHSLTYEHMRYMSERLGVPIVNTVNAKYRDMWDLLDQRNTVPSRVVRFCTDELKIQAFNQWLDQFDLPTLRRMVVLMGMRAGESQNRSDKYGGLTPSDEFTLKDMNPKKVRARFRAVRVRLPIVDLSTQQVFDRLRALGARVNPLYARGHRRVGCYPCILSGKHDFRLASRDPEGRETIIKLANFKDMIVAAKKIANPDVLIPLDLDEILYSEDEDPFGFRDEDDGGGCQWCAM